VSPVRRAARAVCDELERRLLLTASIDPIAPQYVSEGAALAVSVHVNNTSDDANPAPSLDIYAEYGNDDIQYLGAIFDGGGDLYLSHAWPDDGNFTVNVTAGDPSAPRRPNLLPRQRHRHLPRHPPGWPKLR
jgi:hypothetical protein